MNDLLKLIRRNPAIAIGVAAFVGLALGAGWLPIPSLGALVPHATPAAPATPTPPPDPLASY